MQENMFSVPSDEIRRALRFDSRQHHECHFYDTESAFIDVHLRLMFQPDE